jgi:hypothetical protein
MAQSIREVMTAEPRTAPGSALTDIGSEPATT